jgi:multiple sugar transport system ATP-binding protein
MDAYGNMEYGLKVRKFSKSERHKLIMKTAELLQISGLLHRKPDAMSGGERQRVALGRAMVRNPEVFLLDEPLSNLDAALRTEMRYNIMKLHKKLGATFIYVTHDQTEAMTMADSIVVMNKGRAEQADTPERIYKYPANRFVAEFIGTPKMNMIPARIEEQGGRIYLMIGNSGYEAPENRFTREVLDSYKGKTVIAGFRAEDVITGGKQNDNALIELAETMGPETLVHINLLDNVIISRQPGIAEITAGKATGVGFNMNNVHLFDEETGMSLSHISVK